MVYIGLNGCYVTRMSCTDTLSNLLFRVVWAVDGFKFLDFLRSLLFWSQFTSNTVKDYYLYMSNLVLLIWRL